MKAFLALFLSTLLLPSPASGETQSWSLGTQADASEGYRVSFGRLNETIIGKYRYLSSSSKLIWTGDGNAILVLSASNIDESHVASGTLAVVNLKLVNQRFTVVKRWLVAGGASTWGEAPEFSISSKIGPRPVVYTEGGGTWQGCSSGVASLIELTPAGPKSLAEFPVFYEPVDGRGTTGKIANIRYGTSFDVIYSGARRFVDKYVRSGGKYLLTSGPSKAETC